MDINLKIPESVFRTPKTPAQVADEIRQAAALFWAARGDIAVEAMGEVTAPPRPEDDGTLYELLMQGPDVGEDADFERPVDHGRELPASESGLMK
jgi:hypothetical protein